jgi:coenzyme F420-reducing hydrogenase gamma subunit
MLELLEVVDILHFIEGGIYQPDAKVDISLIEGSISTPEDLLRVQKARQNSKLLVTIGACATSGGVQALRNMADGDIWKQSVYAHPEFIDTLKDSTPVAELIKVDFELWGCPVTSEQLCHLIQQLVMGTMPKANAEKLCMECKRQQNVCVVVTKGAPCLGPVVRTGCGALCPQFGKACYGCYGPSEQPNCNSLSNRFAGLGLMPGEIVDKFAAIHSNTRPFKEQIKHWNAIDIRNLE